MRLAFFGDVVGRSGREAVEEYVRENKEKYGFDIVIANGENAARGFGITRSICDNFFSVGIDVITMGNHTFDQRDNLQLFDQERRLVRPLNYPQGTPGHGYFIAEAKNGQKVLVINLIGRVNMEQNDDPFFVVDKFLKGYSLAGNVDAIFIDIHAETTAEKTALARYLDGRVSGVIGTHTHVPTADLQILNGGTGFLSDCGMCGDYDSVIGMEEDAPIKRFTQKINARARMTPSLKTATVCGVVMDINEKGLCSDIQTIRIGGFLKEQRDFS